MYVPPTKNASGGTLFSIAHLCSHLDDKTACPPGRVLAVFASGDVF